MRTLAILATMFTPFVTGAAFAGAFDGNWIGEISDSGPCSGAATMTLTVLGDSLSGVIHNAGNVRSVTGTVDADGNGTFSNTQFHYTGTIKFSADHFDANWITGDCRRHSLGDRAPDAAQSAAIVAQRKQAQATYDSLAAKAAAGDKNVDYTVLRSSYPFTQQWDALSRNTGPLMEQAKVASKGKDCATALEKTDEILKIDYTEIAAHRLRSDCLKGDAARLEASIANSLMKSLMHGGNGRDEKGAYPVMSVQEEKAVLDDKHILLKTRDVEVRGSNGHLYDVVHGFSIGLSLQIEDVYFDVTTEVSGRNSALVAAAVAPATPPN